MQSDSKYPNSEFSMQHCDFRLCLCVVTIYEIRSIRTLLGHNWVYFANVVHCYLEYERNSFPTQSVTIKLRQHKLTLAQQTPRPFRRVLQLNLDNINRLPYSKYPDRKSRGVCCVGVDLCCLSLIVTLWVGITVIYIWAFLAKSRQKKNPLGRFFESHPFHLICCLLECQHLGICRDKIATP